MVIVTSYDKLPEGIQNICSRLWIHTDLRCAREGKADRRKLKRGGKDPISAEAVAKLVPSGKD